MPHIRSVLLGIAILAGMTMVAEAQSGNAARQARRQQQATRLRADRQHLMVRNVTRGLFRGIQLSDAEKTRIKAVREGYKPKVQALRKSFNAEGKLIRDARQRGDSATVRAELQKLAPQRQLAKTTLEAMRTDIRGALTPENQAKFDANAARMKARLADRADALGKRLRRPPGQKQGVSPSA
jgi:Spy/CpxP family protein refolding chaperone